MEDKDPGQSQHESINDQDQPDEDKDHGQSSGGSNKDRDQH